MCCVVLIQSSYCKRRGQQLWQFSSMYYQEMSQSVVRLGQQLTLYHSSTRLGQQLPFYRWQGSLSVVNMDRIVPARHGPRHPAPSLSYLNIYPHHHSTPNLYLHSHTPLPPLLQRLVESFTYHSFQPHCLSRESMMSTQPVYSDVPLYRSPGRNKSRGG